MRNLSLLLVLTILMTCPVYINAQDTLNTLQLIDRTTLIPIVDAYFQIGDQAGISDSDGVIQFIQSAYDTLYLSHISYGNWFLTGEVLSTAIMSSIIFRDKEIITASPITIIALRPSITRSEQFSLENQDRLAHDGGALLTRETAAVGSIRKSGSYGFDPVLRGFKYDQLNIVIDGVQSAIAACPNRMDPPSSQVAPNMVEHIEILKGPHSFRFGTSFGGTINFESIPVHFEKEQRYYGRLTSSVESNHDILRTEAVAGIKGTIYDLGLFASFARGNDYEDGAGVSLPSSFYRSSVGSNLGFRISDTQQFKLSATYNRAKDTDFPALPMDLRSDKTWLFNIQHKVKFNHAQFESLNSTVYGTFVEHEMDNLSKELNPRIINAQTTAQTKTISARTEGVWHYRTSKLYSGLDIKHESAQGERSREFLMGPMAGQFVYDNVWNNGEITKTGLFAEYHYNLSETRFIFSARLEYNISDASDPDSSFMKRNQIGDVKQLNPNFSLGGTTNLSDEITMGLWIGRAQRSAGLTERFINSFPVGLDSYDMLGNPQLTPEINNQIDLTFGYKNQSTRIDLNLFTSLLNNYISSVIDTNLSPTMVSSPGVRRYTNIDDVVMAGFEISWKQMLLSGLEHDLKMAFTYGQDKTRGEPLPEIPPLDLRYSLFSNFFDNTLRYTLTFRYVHNQDRISRTYGETKTPGFLIIDSVISYQFNAGINAIIGVQNLFDRTYYEHLNRMVKGQTRPIYAPGRNFHLLFSFNLM